MRTGSISMVSSSMRRGAVVHVLPARHRQLSTRECLAASLGHQRRDRGEAQVKKLGMGVVLAGVPLCPSWCGPVATAGKSSHLLNTRNKPKPLPAVALGCATDVT